MNEEFRAWLKAEGYDPETLQPKVLKHLEAAWEREKLPVARPVHGAGANPQAAKEPAPVVDGGGFAATMALIAEKNRRIEHFRTRTAEAAKRYVGNEAKVLELKTLCEAAEAEVNAASTMSDLKMDTRDFDLGLLRADRAVGPMVFASRTPEVNAQVVEAAICQQHKLPGIEKTFSDQTLQAAHTNFRHGLGLRRLLLMGARANGFRGDDSDPYTLAKYSMRSRENEEFAFRADVGPSTGIQVPGILSNIANKFIVPSFMFTEQSWRQIAKIGQVNDFKTKTSYRLTGANTYKKVAPGGEIKHGALSETSYTDIAETYGILLGVSRPDMINDDLGAFVSMSQEIGRGAGDVLNNIFWAEFLDDSTFFPTDKSLNNYDDGATDSVLSLAGLENAEAIFDLQTKPDGTPLGADAAILLVPTALGNTASSLMTSELINMATSSVALIGSKNTFQGKFKPVKSRYLSRTSLPDGNGVSQTVTGSSTAWYLLADPNNVTVISVVFLFGKEVPTVESEEFEFNRLGIATRAYYDFGCNKHEYRGGVKMKGAA